ncbi:unnamed protein product [Alopecurus aequalis]
MKALKRELQPARAKTAPALGPKTKGAPAVEAFTARELDAAVQLLHLSESSASSGTARAWSRRAPMGSGGYSSSRSVGDPPALVPAPAILLGGCREEDEEHEVPGAQRRVRRFRLISEIYAATEEIGGGRTGRKNKKD